MKVEINANWEQINKVIALIQDDPDLNLIKQHLIDATSSNDNDLDREIRKNGRDVVIDRRSEAL